jgi:hypothetical protein
MKLLLLLVFCILTAGTCKEKTANSAKVVSSKRSKQVFIDSRGKQYKFFAEIPENRRTPEQKLFAKSLNDVLLNGVVAENNHMVLKMTKEECLAKGMTEKTYDELQTNIKENNHFFDSTGNKKVADMVEDLHRFMKGDRQAKGVSIP